MSKLAVELRCAIIKVMLKVLTSIVVVVLLAVGGYFLYQNFQTKYTPQSSPTPQTTPTAVPTNQPTSSPAVTSNPCQVLTKGSSDVPPLYSGIKWEQPKVMEYEVPLGEGSQRRSGCLIQSSSVGLDSSDRVRDSYTREFENRKWEIESAGDMPGTGFVTWKKGTNYFVLRVNSTDNLNLKTILLFYSK